MNGKEEAIKDFERYKKGEITKNDLILETKLAIYFYNTKKDKTAEDYLMKLSELGFIRIKTEFYLRDDSNEA